MQIADDRAKQETLNRYFDQISVLLFERKLRTAKESDEARIVARARTLIAIRDLDEQRNKQLFSFLRSAGLIEKIDPIISLEDADLPKVRLQWVNLREINLSGVNLEGANLEGADLRETTLIGNLFKANLRGANLEGANLRGALVYGADLSETNLDQVDLEGAYLTGANQPFVVGKKFDPNCLNDPNCLKNAYLCRTRMPDGTKSDYPEGNCCATATVINSSS